jgi:hypothetical protein
VGARLVGDEIGMPAAPHELGEDLRRIADERHGSTDALVPPTVDRGDRLVHVMRQLVDVARLQPAPCASFVHLDDQGRAAVHRDRQRLRAAHPAEAGREGRRPGQCAVEVLACRLRERLVRALDDSLGRDVDPGPGRHLAVHRQAGALELAERLPRGPVRHEVCVGDEHPRRVRRRAEDADRLARLDEERLVVLEPPELSDDGVERLPAAGGPAGAAVDDELVRLLGDLGIQVVHEHPQRGLLLPSLAGKLGASRRADGARDRSSVGPPSWGDHTAEGLYSAN